ncbi:hypothetical protein Tco_0529197 [Tanacetum coccineum]
MSTQQDIYVAGSENRPPMLNKENYVPWSPRLLHYRKSKPNGKLIYNYIMNGPCVRRMIPEPGDLDRKVPVAETFHEQIDDELTKKEVKQMEYDDQAIQIILIGHPKDIYVVVDSCETTQEIWLRVQKMMKVSDIKIQDKKAKLFNEWERFTSTDGESIESYYNRFSKLINDFKRNKHFPEKIASNLKNLNGYKAIQNVGNQVVHNAVQNLGVQYVQNQNGLIVVSGIANPNENQIRNGNVVAAWAEGDLGEIKEVNANCILMANLQQASTSGTHTDNAPVYDSDGSAEVHEYDNCYNNEIFNMFTQEEQYTKLLEPIPEPHQVQQNDNNVISAVSSVEQGGGIVEQNPAIVEETRAYFESLYNNLAIEVEKVNTINSKMKETNADLTTELARYKNQEKRFEINQENMTNLKEAAKFIRDFKSIAKEADESLAKHKTLEFEIKRLIRAIVSHDIMFIVQSNSVVDTSNLQTELDQCKYDKISYDKAYNDMQQKIEWLQAQLGDQKGKSKDTPCVSDTFDSLSQKLEYKNLELEFQVSEQKDTTKGTSANTKFVNQSTSGTKLYSVTPFLNSKVIPKVVKMNDLSKHVTSNSVPTTTESKVMTNDKVIAPRIFRINSFNTSREDKFVPINQDKASVRTNPIIISQPRVITKKHVNSDSNGLSSTGVDNTAKTRREQYKE